jgi:cyclophilin family peptidyl-prolyl cis-trans isomerase
MTQTHPHRFFRHAIEPLEARIAPALVLVNPLADIVAGPGKGATVDLSEMFDSGAEHPNHTLVRFVTSYIDPAAPTVSQEIFIELFDDEAPLTVQNFLHYVQEQKAIGNYEGTFFHRAVTGFVLQGGGIDEKTRSHIDVDLPVHNEFSSARSNLRGTVAMAKVGGDPNSATSEFFFNVADNADQLDDQNGGFTVFARVLTGMEVVDAIVALPRVDQTVPVQNYNRDPDNDPTTKPPAIKRDNLIVIDDIQIIGEKGDASGIVFSLPATGAVTDLNGQPSSLVTAKIVGTDLQLAYNPAGSGVAKVKVQATRDGETVTDEFMVTVKPNLIGNIVVDQLDANIVGGDTHKARLRLGNNGAAALNTAVTAVFYLSKIDGRASDGTALGPDPDGAILDDSDKGIGAIINQHLSLEGGKSITLSAHLNVPKELVSSDARYRVIANLVSGAPDPDQLFTDDDEAIGREHTWTNRFGTFSIGGQTRTHAHLTYVEPDGDTVTLSMNGAGSGRVTVDGNDRDLEVSGTKAGSTLHLTTDRGGRVALHNVEISAPIGAAKLRAVDLSGFFTAAAGARVIELGDINSNSTFSLGAFGKTNAGSAKITLGHVHDVVFESLMPIASLRAVDWLDTQGDNDSLSAPTLGSLTITGGGATRGDFEADVILSAGRPFKSFHVTGFVKDSTITTNGPIASVIVGGMDHANIFAGVTARPTTIDEIKSAADIRSFRVSGVGNENAFIDSDVVARAFNRIVLLGVDGQSGTDDFGIVADFVKHYVRVTPTATIRGTGFDDPARFSPAGEADRDGNFVVKIL